MPAWAALAMDTLWANALTAVPVALIVAGVCRCLPCRPWTRHTLWLLVLAWLIVPPLLPHPPLRASQRSSAIADGVPDAALNDPASGAVAMLQLTPKSAPPIKIAPAPTAAIASDASPPVTRDSAEHKPLSRASRVARSGSTVNVNDASNEPPPSAQTRADETAIYNASPGADRARAPRPVAELVRAEPISSPGLVGEAPELESTTTPLRGWLSGALAIRDAVLALSPIPSSVWLGGLAAIVGLRLVFFVSFFRRLRSAWPAPAATAQMVRDAAASLGLGQAPEAVMVRDRVSPMVWCPPGRNLLILPAGLWHELDDLGRRAVIFHELAHLRRRDHWVSWLQMLVGSVFWWHPVSWWANRRLREEADYCCDAWVTFLLPRGRRAYAEALLRARVHASESIVPMPAVGMGVSISGPNRFARRITMVMTESIRPKFSFSGIGLAIAVALAGWVAAPASSCPPNETTASCKKADKAPKAPKAPKTPKTPKPAMAPTPPSEPTEADDENTFQEHMHKRAPRALGHIETLLPGMMLTTPPTLAPMLVGGPDEKPSDIEKRLERLERQLERLSERLDEMGARPRTPRPDRSELIPQPAQPEWAAPQGEGPGVVARSYALSKGKLEAMIKLMSRPDVRIRIRAAGDKIEVHATEAEHGAFKAFVGLIEDKDKDEVRAYRMPKGQLEDMVALMTRSDVPILVEPSDEEIRVHANTSQQAVFEGFVNLLRAARMPGQGEGRSPQAKHMAEELYRAAVEQHRTLTAEDLAKTEELAALLREHAVQRHEETRAMSETLRQQVGDMEAQVRELEHEAEKLDAEADKLDQEAEKLRGEADKLREEADAIGQPEAAEKLRKQAGGVEEQARSVEEQAEVVRQQARHLEEQAEHLDHQADEIEETADSEED